MIEPTGKQILRLYRHLLRYGNQLKYTNKNYFQQRIRSEFKTNRLLTNPEEIQFNFKRGEALLKNGRIV